MHKAPAADIAPDAGRLNVEPTVSSVSGFQFSLIIDALHHRHATRMRDRDMSGQHGDAGL